MDDKKTEVHLPTFARRNTQKGKPVSPSPKWWKKINLTKTWKNLTENFRAFKNGLSLYIKDTSSYKLISNLFSKFFSKTKPYTVTSPNVGNSVEDLPDNLEPFDRAVVNNNIRESYKRREQSQKAQGNSPNSTPASTPASSPRASFNTLTYQTNASEVKVNAKNRKKL